MHLWSHLRHSVTEDLFYITPEMKERFFLICVGLLLYLRNHLLHCTGLPLVGCTCGLHGLEVQEASPSR